MLYALGAISIQCVILVNAIKRLRRFLLDGSGLMSLLFLVFYCFPAWDYIYDFGLLTHEYVEDYGILRDFDHEIKRLFVVSFSYFMFILGYAFQEKTKRNRKVTSLSTSNRGINKNNYWLIQFFLLGSIAIVIIHQYQNYGGDLISFILPSRKNNIKSELEDLIQYLFPIIAINLAVIKCSGKIKLKKIIPYVLVAILSASISAQRRDMISMALFIGMILFADKFLLLNSSMMKLWGNKKIRKKILLLGISMIIAIPLFWYARNFSSQYSRGDVIVKPWEIRGFFELIFGSSSSGFETLLILDANATGLLIPFCHCLLFMVFMYIPRSIFADKPMQITQILKNYLGTDGNLSLFMVNDLIYSFGIIAPIAAFVFGMCMFNIYGKNIRSNDMFLFSRGVFVLASFVLLFKNGLSMFFFNYFAYIFIMFVVKKILYKRG